MRFDRSTAVLAALWAVATTGCAVTNEDIDTWMGTIRGPGKIVAVLMSDRYADELRIHAGLALVQMERSDVDGVSELQTAIRRLDEEPRRRVVDGMAPGLLALMQGQGQAQTDGPTAPPLQVRAKDASFLVLQYASPPIQQQLTEGVVGWFVEDFNGRSLAGNFSAEQVVRQLGAPAATRLVDAMNAHLPQDALTKIAELVSQIGDDPTKARAAERLVAIEHEMESPEFTAWLGERLRHQAETEHRTLTDAQVAGAVALNREQFITLGALPAMHHLAGVDAVSDRLLEMGRDTTTPGEAGETRRVTALMAMEGHVRDAQVQPLLRLALDARTPTRVRDYAFDRIADSRSRDVIPQLWPMATSAATTDAAWRQRWRVGSLILTLGGADVAQEWVNRLPSAPEITYAREELHGYAEKLASMHPPPAALMTAQLASTDWWDRAIALYYFERVGVEADLARLQPLCTDATPTHGEHWEEHGTIGTIATDTIAAIRERLASGAAAGAGAAPAAPAPG